MARPADLPDYKLDRGDEGSRRYRNYQDHPVDVELEAQRQRIGVVDQHRDQHQRVAEIHVEREQGPEIGMAGGERNARQ